MPECHIDTTNMHAVADMAMTKAEQIHKESEREKDRVIICYTCISHRTGRKKSAKFAVCDNNANDINDALTTSSIYIDRHTYTPIFICYAH